MIETKRPKLELLSAALVEQIVDEGLTLLEQPRRHGRERRGPGPSRRRRGRRRPRLGAGPDRPEARRGLPGHDPGRHHALRPGGKPGLHRRRGRGPFRPGLGRRDPPRPRHPDGAQGHDGRRRRHSTSSSRPWSTSTSRARASSPPTCPAAVADALPALPRPAPVREAVRHRDLPGRGLRADEGPPRRGPRRRERRSGPSRWPSSTPAPPLPSSGAT